MARSRQRSSQRMDGRSGRAGPPRPQDGPASPAPEPVPTFPADVLVEAIPSPALVIDRHRRIEAVNRRFCSAFGLDHPRLHAGEPFAEFARRSSLSGTIGFLALGDLLAGAVPPAEVEVVSKRGTVLVANACHGSDGRILITLFASTRRNLRTPDEIALNILENMPGSLLRLLRDPDGRFRCLFASPLSGPIFGIESAALTAPDRDFRDLIADRHRAPFEEAAARGESGPTAIDLEIQIKQTSGTLLWVRCVGATVPGDDGNVVCDVRMIDIENRRRVVEERQQLQDLLDLVVDNIPFTVSVRDARDRSIVIVNRAFEEMSGHRRNDILGRSEMRLFPNIDFTDREDRERNLVENGEIIDIPEEHVRTPTMGMRIVRTRKYPLYGDDGAVRYILAITEDVTERRQAANALRQSEQRFRDAIESLTDGIALFDQDEKLVLCNNRYRSMWPGFETSAVPGVPFEALVRRYLGLAAASGMKIEIEKGVKDRLDRFRNPPSTGEVPLYNGRWLQVADRLTADGGVVVTCTDITALKEREASLRHANGAALHAKEAAEKASRAKSDFLANMSHELRTPLNAVIGFSEIIKDAILGNGSIDAYRGYATDIHESGRHLLSLINDILDMSKIEAGKLELIDETVDLTAAIGTSLRLLRERALHNRIDLAADVAEALPLLRADLRKVKQIMINLLSNAVKFTPAGGRVTIRAFQRDDGGVTLCVEDTGIGIAEEDIETVLAPFGQADTGLNRQYEGTGLGLSLTKALAELHGGRLEIASRTDGPDRGTTVEVNFPASRVIR